MPTILVFYHLSLLTVSFLQNETSSNFDDMGTYLLGGFVLAVAIAVALTFFRLRLRDRKPPAQFISISSFRSTDEPAKVRRDS